MRNIIESYKHTYLFYFLATLLPWSLWGIAAYISHSTDYAYPGEMASMFAFLGLLAPTIVASILISKNKALLLDIKQRTFNFKSGKPQYWILVFTLMPVSILLAQLISLGFGHSVSQFQFSDQYSFSSGIFPVWFLLILAPLIEELAWHSYGTDCLVNRFNLFKASMIFAAFWGVWHMPLSFINDYYHSNLVETGSLYGINFLLSIFPFVIIMNWLYFKTGRSILSAIIFHITAGYFNEVFATHPDSKVIQTGILIVVSVVILIKDKELFFGAWKHRPNNLVPTINPIH